MFLQKDKKEVAEAKIAAWREQAREFGYTDKDYPEKDAIDKPVMHLARSGFNLKEKAPKVRDRHKKFKGLCCENWEHLQNWDFLDVSTKDEIRYFIPRLIPSSKAKNLEEQQDLVQKIADNIKEQCKELKNIDISIGEANQIANQILAHYNQTKERVPLERFYARTLTRSSVSRRLFLGNFDSDGLRCSRWDWGGAGRDSLGVFALGVEKLGK